MGRKRANLFVIHREIGKGKSWVLMAATLGALVLVWFLVSNFTGINSIFLPTPQATFRAMWSALKGGSLLRDVKISCYRVFMGFFISAVIGVPIGILAGTYKLVAGVVKPLTGFIRYLPVSALIPLIMVWTGVGELAKITIIVVGTVFSLITIVSDVAHGVSNDLIHSAYTLGAGQWQTIMRVVVPAILPSLLDSLRTVMGWAWTYLVMAEMLASSSGLGYTIMIAERFMKTYIIFMGIFAIGILGLLIDRVFALLRRVFFRWAEEE
jgi:NitT/TauT family transport system permease protein